VLFRRRRTHLESVGIQASVIRFATVSPNSCPEVLVRGVSHGFGYGYAEVVVQEAPM
jgi:hypothetical protein